MSKKSYITNEIVIEAKSNEFITGEVIKELQPLFIFLAKQVGIFDYDLEDAVQLARIRCLSAIKSYNKEKRCSAHTWLANHIKWSFRDFKSPSSLKRYGKIPGISLNINYEDGEEISLIYEKDNIDTDWTKDLIEKINQLPTSEKEAVLKKLNNEVGGLTELAREKNRSIQQVSASYRKGLEKLKNMKDIQKINKEKQHFRKPARKINSIPEL